MLARDEQGRRRVPGGLTFLPKEVLRLNLAQLSDGGRIPVML